MVQSALWKVRYVSSAVWLHRTMHAKTDMSILVRMMPLAVLVPTNALLGLVMPASGLTEKQHQPFTHAVTIERMEDRIDVMTSLQRPKKVCPSLHF